MAGLPHAPHVVGVEINGPQAADAAETFASYPNVSVVNADFFAFDGSETFDAVVGNPPFVRYQSFPEPSRSKARARCMLAGVNVSRLASSWSHFVVAGSERLRDGGMLGFVLPVELLHAGYAKPVLRYLERSFGSILVLTFQERLFPELSQDTLILIAERRGEKCRAMRHVDARSIDEIAGRRKLPQGRAVDPGPYLSGAMRLKQHAVAPAATGVLERLLRSGAAFRLGERFCVDIGYVSGNNDFFHLSRADVKRLGIGREYLTPSLFRGRALRGICFTADDWRLGDERGAAGYLLHVQRSAALDRPVRDYVSWGEERGFAGSFKCRTRAPWYCVPHVHRPDAFLTSMSGSRPSIVVNDENVAASNSLHIVRARTAYSAGDLSMSWLSSFTELSIELEGHALGGGMLKLEPGEAERVAVLAFEFTPDERRAADRLIRGGDVLGARALVDESIAARIDVTGAEIAIARDAAEQLRNRRRKLKPARGRSESRAD